MESDPSIPNEVEANAGRFASEFQGAEPSVVIDAVQTAWMNARVRAAGKKLAYEFASMTLELAGLTTVEAGAEATFKIPFLEWELGPKAGLKSATTQSIVVTLEPITIRKFDWAAGLEAPLTDALVAIAQVVSAGQARGLQLKEASAVIEFAVTKSGSLKVLVVTPGVEQVTTQKLTVTLKPTTGNA